MTFEQIVVGTDGSQTSARAIAEAAQLALVAGSRLLIVSAYGQPPGTDREEAERRVAGAVDAAREAGLTTAATTTMAGAPAEVLVALAAEHDADLLVVGSKGMTDDSRFVLGSVANHVSHHAPCDVLVARTSVRSPDFHAGAESGNIES